MAKKLGLYNNPKMLSWLVFVFIFTNMNSCKGSREKELLLSMKASIKDPLKSLMSWNSSLAYCQWNGIICDNSSHVAKFELSGKNLSGKILDTIFQFPFVESIDLSSNQFFGEIPRKFSRCSSLRYLNISNNNFSGSIPSGGSFVSRLETLDLSNNMLSGKIPEDIGSVLGNLKVLDLGGNLLIGDIPKSITSLRILEVFTLASNQLTGEIPRELRQMKSLKWIYLGYNNFSGAIPSEIGELTSLYHLDLVYNNLSGEIPSSLGNLSNLQYLFLYLNKLSGPIPHSIFGLQKLISLDLSDNLLSGEIPEQIIHLQNLEILQLFSNNFTGKIPNGLASLPRLQVLQLWSNRFSGEIPGNLGKFSNLTILDLSTNNLTGKIPDGLCESGRLFKLILFSNSLEGKIPDKISRCRSLQRVRLQNNKFSGELPPEFTKLPAVYFFDISGNNLDGPISNRKWDMLQLQMLSLARNRFSGALPDSFGSSRLENLDLSGNIFTGSIPRRFGTFSELMELKLSSNKLSGKIPEELSSCRKLVTLDLSLNHLSGEIPSSVCDMPVLGQLDLSANELSGEIPPNLGKVQPLVQVNISHNHFHGRLPATGAFLATNSSSVSGNDHLCGGPETSGLPPCKRAKAPICWWFLTSLLAILALVGLAGFVVASAIRRRKELDLKTIESAHGTWELQVFDLRVSKSLSLQDVVASIAEEKAISREAKGVSYKMSSKTDPKIQILMKEITAFHSDSSPEEYWREIRKVGKLGHSNIIRLLGACRSEKGGILMYEYVEGKELSEALKGLSWERRQKVAIGIARALRYLHCSCSPSVLIGELSPTKIIIDGKDEARLRLSFPVGMVYGHNKCFVSSRYVAPEITHSESVTEKSDIYGFGLVLIELLTGKSPGDAEFGLHKRIVEWARYCYSDCHIDFWVDPTVKPEALTNHQNKIVETMNLALQCTATEPAVRPGADEVVETLDSIFRPSSCVSIWELMLSRDSNT